MAVARLTRLGVGGWPHLVVQAVQHGQALWRDAQDAQALHTALVDASRQCGVAVHAYRLGDAGLAVGAGDAGEPVLALVLTPADDEALSLFMQAVGRRYVAAYNRRHGRRGSLWAGRYRSTVLDAARYLLDAMLWVEQPAWLASGVAHAPEQAARHCSLGHHLGQGSDPLVTDSPLFWAMGNTPFDRELAWRGRLAQGLGGVQAQALADAVHKGWALVSQEEAPGLEKVAGRRLQPRPRGRPRQPPL
jgi:putative transposase